MTKDEEIFKNKLKRQLRRNPNNLKSYKAISSAPVLLDILEELIEEFYVKNKYVEYLQNDNFDAAKQEVEEIFNLLAVLTEIISTNNNIKLQLRNRFVYLHNQLKTYLHIKPTKEDPKEEISKYKILQNIMNKLENAMLMLYIDNPNCYDPNKEEFINYLLFNQKNFSMIAQACDKFPHLVNIVDEKTGEPLILKVLDKYLEALEKYLQPENLGPLDDLLYYDQVLNLLCFSEKMQLDPKSQKQLLEKVDRFKKSHTCSSNRKNEKLSFFTNVAAYHISKIEEPTDVAYLSYKYEIHMSFKAAHILEAKTISLQKQSIGPKTTNKKIYTFDGEGAKELDDGLSIEKENGVFHLGVHIADPTAYIPFNSILFAEAKRRTTSIYIGDYCIPMFPFELSGDLMSLNVGKNTYCMSYYFDIDEKTGELLNFEAKSEICEIAGNLTYDYFDEYLRSGEEGEFKDTLRNLVEVSNILKRIYKEDTLYHQFHNERDRTVSRTVVENCMIYTNYQLAKWFDEHKLPFIYRCHTINEEDQAYLSLLQERFANDEATLLHTVNNLKNQYPRAVYNLDNTGHFGLGIPYYSHSTSPLRRLADNVGILCVKKFMLSNNYTEEDIDNMIRTIQETSDTINSKRNSVDRYESKCLSLKYPEQQKAH